MADNAGNTALRSTVKALESPRTESGLFRGSSTGENHEIAETRIPRFLIGPQPKKSLVAAEVKIVVKMGSRNE